MPAKKPLVLYEGYVEELHTGDTLNATTLAGGDTTELQWNNAGNLDGCNNTYWDSANEYLGLGSFTGGADVPLTRLHVKGDITADNIGTVAQYDDDDVTITGGTITGITDLAVADGGTGASTAQAAINTLSAVSGASSGDVLVSDGADAVWAAPTDTKHIIQEEGADVDNPRAYLNFVGAGLIASDDSGNDATKVTLYTSATAAVYSIPISGAGGTIDTDYLVAATTSVKGSVQLSNSYSGTDDTKAATEKALSDGLADATSAQKRYAIIFG